MPVTRTDTVNGGQQAASTLAVYSVGASGQGRPPRREPRVRPHAPCACCLSPFPVPLPPSHRPAFPPLSWPRLGLSRSALVGALGLPQCPPVLTRAWVSGLQLDWRWSLSLFDLRGSFLEFIVFYCTWWVFGGRGEESLSSAGVSVPSETFTKVTFSCFWRGYPHLPSGTGGQGLGPPLLPQPGLGQAQQGRGPQGLRGSSSLGLETVARVS